MDLSSDSWLLKGGLLLSLLFGMALFVRFVAFSVYVFTCQRLFKKYLMPYSFQSLVSLIEKIPPEK